MPDGAHARPRHPALGWRLWSERPRWPPPSTGTQSGLTNLIPESGIELRPDDSYILEAGFERLHGVDFRKGCYVGQEVTARMKHKTDLRKGLVRVALIERGPGRERNHWREGKSVGRSSPRAQGRALALMRLDRCTGRCPAGPAR
jgi:folate-binding protein YgfZ